MSDFPKPGIIFLDITLLLTDPNGLKKTTEAMVSEINKRDFKPTIIAGTESRGFIFGVALAEALGLGFVPVRKPCKLPRAIYSVSYELEYGNDSLEINQDAFLEYDKVLVLDDLLATSGTAKATAELITKTGASICGMIFMMKLNGLGSREVLKSQNITALLKF
jgi:adenine phosphoribosyltransferase